MKSLNKCWMVCNAIFYGCNTFWWSPDFLSCTKFESFGLSVPPGFHKLFFKMLQPELPDLTTTFWMHVAMSIRFFVCFENCKRSYDAVSELKAIIMSIHCCNALECCHVRQCWGTVPSLYQAATASNIQPLTMTNSHRHQSSLAVIKHVNICISIG